LLTCSPGCTGAKTGAEKKTFWGTNNTFIIAHLLTSTVGLAMGASALALICCWWTRMMRLARRHT